jgi:acyl-coenzyme A thioesterase PaaI-like protein
MSNLQEHFRALTPARDRRLQTRTTPASLTYFGLGDTNGGVVLNINETGMAVAVANHLVVGDGPPTHSLSVAQVQSKHRNLSAACVASGIKENRWHPIC